MTVQRFSGGGPAYETSARIAANKCAIINPLGRYALGFRTSVSAQFCTWMSPDRLQPALEWSSCEPGLSRPRPIAPAGPRSPRARPARAGPPPRPPPPPPPPHTPHPTAPPPPPPPPPA